MYLKKRHCHQFTHPPINYRPGVPGKVDIWAPIVGREAPPPHRPAGSRCRNHQQLLCTHSLLKFASSKALVIAAIIISSNKDASKNHINYINHITFDCNGLQCLRDKKVDTVEGRSFLLLTSKSLLLSQLNRAKQCWQQLKQPNAEYWLQTVDAHKVEALISNLQYLITIFNFNIQKGRRGQDLWIW